MGLRSTLTTMAASAAARRAAPVAATHGVRQFLARSVEGFPGFPSAREVARKQLERTKDVDRAVSGVIEQHVRLAGGQGFLTNLGGWPLLPVTLPANIAGLAVLQVRMCAAIAYLRGYDILDTRVRAAALMAVLGHQEVEDGIRAGVLPGTPREVALGANTPDTAALDQVTAMVGQALVTRVGGKRATLMVTRRVPVLGGAVSAGVDAYSTYTVGRYADREFPTYTMIERA